MSSISLNTGSCCPPGGPAATGGGPVLDPALDAAPTGSAPIGGAPSGTSELPPPPGSTDLPGAGTPTGFDSTPVDVAGGGPAYLPAPAPIDIAGVSGAVDPGSSTASVTGGGPGGVPPVSGDMAGVAPMSAPQPMPGWDANYGDAFAKAFDQAGVDPATASAALHSLAAMGASADELDDTLAYLQTEDGASLAPYMAEELAGQAPSYARIGLDGQGTSQVPGGTGQVDPTTGQPIDGAPTPVGQTEDGGVQMSDGSISYEDGSVIQPDGTMIAPDGSTLSPDGVLTRPDGTTSQIDMETGQEIDPTTGQPIDPAVDPETGQPIDPNAAEDPEGAPQEGGGMPGWAKLGLGMAGLAVIGGGIHAYRNRDRAIPLPSAEPVDLRHAGRDARTAARAGATPDVDAPRAPATPDTPNARAGSFSERFAQNRADILGGAESKLTPRSAPVETPRVAPSAAQARTAALREAMGEYREKGSVPFSERFGHTMSTGRHNVQGAHRLGGISTARAAESVETLAYRDAVKNIGKNAAREGLDNLGADAARTVARGLLGVAKHAR